MPTRHKKIDQKRERGGHDPKYYEEDMTLNAMAYPYSMGVQIILQQSDVETGDIFKLSEVSGLFIKQG